MKFFPFIRAKKPSIVMGLLMSAPILLSTLNPITSLYVIILIFFAYPVLLCISALWCGSLVFLTSLASALTAAALSFGMNGLMLSALFLVPFCACFVYVVEKQIPFLRAGVSMAAVLLLSQLLCFAYLNSLTGGDLYHTAGEAFGNLLLSVDKSGSLLVMLYQYGMVSLSNAAENEAFRAIGNMYMLTAAGRKEILLSLTTQIEDTLKVVPAQFIFNSIMYSAGGLGLSLYIGRVSCQRRRCRAERSAEVKRAIEERKAAFGRGEEGGRLNVTPPDEFYRQMAQAEEEIPEGFPDLKMPGLSKWYLPRGFGIAVFAFAAGYLLQLLSDNETLNLLGMMMSTVFASIYTLQGMGALSFLHHKAGRSKGSSRGWLIAIFLLAQGLLVVIGVIEQATNFRALRPPLNKNTEE